MYRFLITLAILTLLSPLTLAASRTVVTRTPVYHRPACHNPYHRHNNNHYRHHNTWNNNAYRNPSRVIYNRRPTVFNNRSISSSSFSDLGALEKYALNRNYSRESDLQRLQRLEMEAFGAIQSGDLNCRYDNVRNAILSRPKQNYKTSLLRNIGNYFNGQMTGFTPSFSNDPFFSNSGFATTQFPTNFGNQSIVDYGSGPFNRGSYINNYGTGSSTGVRILD